LSFVPSSFPNQRPDIAIAPCTISRNAVCASKDAVAKGELDRELAYTWDFFESKVRR